MSNREHKIRYLELQLINLQSSIEKEMNPITRAMLRSIYDVKYRSYRGYLPKRPYRKI